MRSLQKKINKKRESFLRSIIITCMVTSVIEPSTRLRVRENSKLLVRATNRIGLPTLRGLEDIKMADVELAYFQGHYYAGEIAVFAGVIIAHAATKVGPRNVDRNLISNSLNGFRVSSYNCTACRYCIDLEGL